jgi:uncharacterized protein YwgA
MTRRDWLLVFAAYEGAADGLDPVRFQKGLFLFSRLPDVPARERYTFKPYDYGPMSSRIYDDLDALVDEGSLRREPVPGKRWCRYQVTDAGLRSANQLLDQARREGRVEAARQLHAIKQTVAGLGFKPLLEHVYAAHPDFAVNSVFSRQR